MKIKVAAISGSLRKGSYNTAILHAAEELMPDGMSLEILDISLLPFYNADVEKAGDPAAVKLFKDKISKADALLIATPEYNYSVPGILKNAIDWASRPTRKSPLWGKPVAIMGASTSAFGTVRAQLHLRDMCLYNDMPIVRNPEVLIMKAEEKFDKQGKLTDKDSREFIRKLMASLADLTELVASQQEPAKV
jgi:chromate reductase, NAD(P)H dehydrogenase (quinone)